MNEKPNVSAAQNIWEDSGAAGREPAGGGLHRVVHRLQQEPRLHPPPGLRAGGAA